MSKPTPSRFWQQTLPSWKPLQTPNKVANCMTIVGVLYVPIGIALLLASNSVTEISVRYDNACMICPPIVSNISASAGTSTGARTSTSVSTSTSTSVIYGQLTNDEFAKCNYTNTSASDDLLPAIQQPCMTYLTIPIPKDMPGPVYVYYQLTNFYSNNRLFVKSKSANQLTGVTVGDTTDCDNSDKSPDGRTYYPCGYIAASFFNDTIDAAVCSGNVSNSSLVFTSFAYNTSICTTLGFHDHSPADWSPDITWSTDRAKFVNDDSITNPNGALSSQYARVSPANISLPPINDPDFVVWMRTSAFFDFKKLYRIIHGGLRANTTLYLQINNRYQVAVFKGTKSIVLSTTSWFGGKNSFIGVAFISAGVTSMVLAAIFIAKHKIQPREYGDMKYFLWPGQSRPIR